MLSGTLSPESARAVKNREGKSLEEILSQAGMEGGSLNSVPLAKGYYHAFLELHIEAEATARAQRNSYRGLSHSDCRAGDSARKDRGSGGTRGRAMLMPERRDAFLAASG